MYNVLLIVEIEWK